MYADAVSRIAESMFPIFFVQPEGDGAAVAVNGTGFFVDDGGLFMTADHFMAPVPAGATLYYYGKVPDHVCQPAVEIECVARDPERDLYLGRVARDYLRPVVLATEAVRPGDSVCLAGYPMAVVVAGPGGGFVGNVRRYLQPSFVIDATQSVIGGRRCDGYIVQHACLPGMSGGPVFDREGRVRGMAMANLTRTIPDPDGNAIVVSNGMVIAVDHLRRFIDALGPQ
jgi:S1-C subfamily serine protease